MGQPDVHPDPNAVERHTKPTRFDADVGFFTTAPVSQQTDFGAQTDNSGGVADDTFEAVAGSGADGAINNNFAGTAAALNDIRAALRNLGLMA